MSRISQYELSDGRKAQRISDCEETDSEVVKALISRFDDQVISVKIEDRVIRIRDYGNS